MRGMNAVASFVVAIALTACSTPFGSSGLTGGFSEKKLEGNIWHITYGGNGYTSVETVQTYWLYRSAQLALAQGFDGFEIVSNIQLVGIQQPLIQVAAGPVIVPLYFDIPKPLIEADIRLLKAPFRPNPPKVFDALQLKSALEQHVNGQKCGGGNVCAHVHRYLQPIVDTAEPSKPATVSPADRLRALKELLDQNAVTQQEYDARRSAILDGL